MDSPTASTELYLEAVLALFVSRVLERVQAITNPVFDVRWAGRVYRDRRRGMPIVHQRRLTELSSSIST
jgi:hypothetical protein